MGDAPNRDSEQLLLYVLIAAIGMIPVIVVIMHGGVFGSEPTIGLLMLGVAIVGLLAMWRLARRGQARR